MEFPERLTRLERGLAALLLAAVAAIGWAEAGSSLACALRRGAPWLFWLSLAPEGPHPEPRLFLSIYHPHRRSLDLVHVQGPSRRARPRASVSIAEAAAAELSPDLPPDSGIEGAAVIDAGSWAAAAGLWAEPPAAAKAWLLARAGGPGPSPRGAFVSELGLFDRLLLGLEWRRLPEGAIRPAWLPEKELRRDYFARLYAARDRGSRGEAALTVEVFNASPRKGLASHATKILRLRGADVVGVGNSPGPQATSVVYDRTGRFENAAAARRMLGCPAAEAITMIDAKRLVDVSVILAEDCAGPEAPGGEPDQGGQPWN